MQNQTTTHEYAVPVAGWPMSRGQLMRYAQDEIERLDDDPSLDDWLPEVVGDLETWQVGVFRCGTTHCPGSCDGDDCECCENEDLWESPLVAGWEPECYCGRKALLVMVA